MFRITLASFLASILFFNSAQSQNYKLIGLIGQNLVLIDSTSADLETYAEILNMPEGENLTGLTYNSTNNLFYSIEGSTTSPSLVSISKEGDYQIIGNFSSSGTQITSVESLAYNAEENKLYASVSLNGGVANNDFFSESIMEVNVSTGECYFLTEINTDAAFPDIDVMTFKENILYIYDGIPPGGNSFNLYQLNISSVNSLTSPELIYKKNDYLPMNDVTATGHNLYFTEKRNLYKYNFSNSLTQLIGLTHLIGNYSGKLIKGISKIKCLFSCFFGFGR